jgi:hypothetical protein
MGLPQRSRSVPCALGQITSSTLSKLSKIQINTRITVFTMMLSDVVIEKESEPALDGLNLAFPHPPKARTGLGQKVRYGSIFLNIYSIDSFSEAMVLWLISNV